MEYVQLSLDKRGVIRGICPAGAASSRYNEYFFTFSVKRCVIVAAHFEILPTRRERVARLRPFTRDCRVRDRSVSPEGKKKPKGERKKRTPPSPDTREGNVSKRFCSQQKSRVSALLLQISDVIFLSSRLFFPLPAL